MTRKEKTIRRVLLQRASSIDKYLGQCSELTPMDREYFKHAVFCLIDNAAKYKTVDSDIDVKIGKKEITVTNKTELDKFTPGTGIAIAGRILEQHRLKLKTKLEDGVFEAKISKK